VCTQVPKDRGWSEHIERDGVQGAKAIKSAVKETETVTVVHAGQRMQFEVDTRLMGKLKERGIDLGEMLKRGQTPFSPVKKVSVPFSASLTLALLDKAPHLFADGEANGFMGVHESVFDIEDQSILEGLLITGIMHELRHEAKVPGHEDETLMAAWDQLLLFQLFGAETTRIIEQLRKEGYVCEKGDRHLFHNQEKGKGVCPLFQHCEALLADLTAYITREGLSIDHATLRDLVVQAIEEDADPIELVQQVVLEMETRDSTMHAVSLSPPKALNQAA